MGLYAGSHSLKDLSKMAEVRVLDRGQFYDFIVGAGYRLCHAYVFDVPILFELGS